MGGSWSGSCSGYGTHEAPGTANQTVAEKTNIMLTAAQSALSKLGGTVSKHLPPKLAQCCLHAYLSSQLLPD